MEEQTRELKLKERAELIKKYQEAVARANVLQSVEALKNNAEFEQRMKARLNDVEGFADATVSRLRDLVSLETLLGLASAEEVALLTELIPEIGKAQDSIDQCVRQCAERINKEHDILQKICTELSIIADEVDIDWRDRVPEVPANGGVSSGDDDEDDLEGLF